MKHVSQRVTPLWPVVALALLITGISLGLSLPARAGEDKITNALGMTFIRIQPGSFTMGSPATEKYRGRDEQQHPQTITAAFYLQETEVTLAQWRALMGKRWFMRIKGEDDMPVTRVSWHDCIKYIEKLNARGQGRYRLPTEAEWEYACRAGSTTAYSWGDEIDCSKALYGNNALKASECIPFLKDMDVPQDSPAPVKTFAPNPWGLYDMHGNVWEWCRDIYGDYLSKDEGGTGVLDSESRIRRGGSWYKHASSLRSANRTYAHPGARFKTTGFRLVLEAD